MSDTQNQNGSLHLISGSQNNVLCVAVGLALMLWLLPLTQAQTYAVIHDFTGGMDGANPAAGLTMDAAGNLYGTTFYGGVGNGTVFRLTRKNSHWLLSPLFTFSAASDGAVPTARVVFGPDGRLYGTTEAGGDTSRCYFGDGHLGCGTVFRLNPPATFCASAICPWTETVLFRFIACAAGCFPDAEVTFDQAGSLYSTTAFGGAYGHCNAEGDACGTVYKLTRSGNNWSEEVLYEFGQVNDGSEPIGGVILDSAGNLYGTTDAGGFNYGTVFELSPGSLETLLYKFNVGNTGAYPAAGLIMDSLGALYGATTSGGAGGGGTVFKLVQAGGIWTLANLHSFTGNNGGPAQSLVMDPSGNLYGTTKYDGAHGYGSVFKLTRSGDSWTYTSLYDFTGGSDGGAPVSNVVFDQDGNLYGTTFIGGTGPCNFTGAGCGVVWKITP